jgi:hypothetical protein
MLISVVNHTNGMISDEDLQRAIRAINRQVREDFEPNWGMGATLHLAGRTTEAPDKISPPDLRGDAIIYLWDHTDVPGALGYHYQTAQGVPFGFVFAALSKEIGEEWSVTLSHEVLELIGDSETNLLVMGPHPKEARDVFHWYEMCDAVQAESYEIDGVLVSNFVLPLYFTGTRDFDEIGTRNDFLGRSHDGETLRSFGINPGGYIGFFDPKTGQHETVVDDALAAARLAAKSKMEQTRRSIRYRQYDERRVFAERMQSLGRERAARAALRPARNRAKVRPATAK